MDELRFLRTQVALERSHMASVRRACADALALPADRIAATVLDEFCMRCAAYLVFIVARFHAQDQAHCDQLRPLLDADALTHREALDDLDRTLAQSRVALDALSDALRERMAAPPQDSAAARAFIESCRSYLSFYDRVLARRRHALSPLIEQHYRMAEWRTASMVTADSVFEESDRYAQVAASLPAGVALQTLEQRAAARAAAEVRT
jgi:hypothetical protein